MFTPITIFRPIIIGNIAICLDFNYGYGNVFWHTPQDTLDKLSSKSIAIVGQVLLETVRMLDASDLSAESRNH